MTVVAWIGIGSNLGEPLAYMRRAWSGLQQMPRTRTIACSGLYRTPPVGPRAQPDFINAVAQIETSLSPALLLDSLQRIEDENGRRRSEEQWGPRTLDLDVLLYGDRMIEHERLVVPHLHMTRRGFVLVPLAEMAPDLEIPGKGSVARWLAECDVTGIVRVDARIDQEGEAP